MAGGAPRGSLCGHKTAPAGHKIEREARANTTSSRSARRRPLAPCVLPDGQRQVDPVARRHGCDAGEEVGGAAGQRKESDARHVWRQPQLSGQVLRAGGRGRLGTTRRRLRCHRPRGRCRWPWLLAPQAAGGLSAASRRRAAGRTGPARGARQERLELGTAAPSRGGAGTSPGVPPAPRESDLA